MGVITNLHNRLETVRVNHGVATLVYDRNDSINEDSKNNYPMLVYRVVQSSSENYRNTKEKPTYQIDFYIADLYYQGDTQTITEKLDSLDNTLDSVLVEFQNEDFQIMNNSTAEFGWEQYNDNLVVVRRTVTVMAFKCKALEINTFDNTFDETFA
jgi:hypothetical protein